MHLITAFVYVNFTRVMTLHEINLYPLDFTACYILCNSLGSREDLVAYLLFLHACMGKKALILMYMKTNHYTILLVIYINIYLESSVIAGWIYKMKKLFKNIIKQLYRYIYSKTILIKIGHSWKTTLRKSMKIMKKKQKPLQSDNLRTVIKKKKT